MKFIFISISIIILSSCSEKIDTRTPEQKRQDQCALAKGRTTVAFAEKMWRERGLEPIGSGGGGSRIPGKGSRMLSVTFLCYQEVDIAQARKLLLECVQEFLDEINNTKELEPCLYPFPFTYKNISISLLFTNKSDGNFVKFPSLAAGSADEGEISYYIKRDDVLEKVGEETCEEALRLVGKD